MSLGRLLATFFVLAPVAVAAPAGADSNDFRQIFDDYKSDGRLNDCYRPDQLHNAGREIPPDIEQYAPGFGDALAGAQVGCNYGGPPAAAEDADDPVSAGIASPPETPKKKKTVPAPPAPEPAASAVPTSLADPRLVPGSASAAAGKTPGALIALLIAAGLAVVLALGWTLAWFMGWSPERLTKPLFAAFETVWDRVLPGR